jgi:hypothetical protein
VYQKEDQLHDMASNKRNPMKEGDYYYLKTNLLTPIVIVDAGARNVHIADKPMRYGRFVRTSLVMRSLLITPEERDKELARTAKYKKQAEQFRRENALNGR